MVILIGIGKHLVKFNTYADDKKIPFVAIVGGNEMEANTVMLKNMTTGEQKQVTLQELIGNL